MSMSRLLAGWLMNVISNPSDDQVAASLGSWGTGCRRATFLWHVGASDDDGVDHDSSTSLRDCVSGKVAGGHFCVVLFAVDGGDEEGRQTILAPVNFDHIDRQDYIQNGFMQNTNAKYEVVFIPGTKPSRSGNPSTATNIMPKTRSSFRTVTRSGVVHGSALIDRDKSLGNLIRCGR